MHERKLTPLGQYNNANICQRDIFLMFFLREFSLLNQRPRKS